MPVMVNVTTALFLIVRLLISKGHSICENKETEGNEGQTTKAKENPKKYIN